EVTDLSLFQGEVTVQRVDAKVNASADATGGLGDFAGTGVTNIGGSAVVGHQLGDWGTLTLGGGTGTPTETAKTHAWRGNVVALAATSSPCTAWQRTRTRSAPRAPTSAGTTATTSSRRLARRSSRSRTAGCSRSAGTRSAAGGCGSRTGRETSSTTRTCPRSRP